MDTMTLLNTSTISWPTSPAEAERQAAAYLPLHGSRTDLLPRPWPTSQDEEPFPKPTTVLRELTTWLSKVGPQPITSVPQCTQQWLMEIPPSHVVMRAGIPWLQAHNEALWPSVAVADLLSLWETVRRGQPTPFTVPAVQEAVELWTIYQAMRTHVHAAIGHVAKTQGLLPNPDPVVVDALIAAWRDRLGTGKAEGRKSLSVGMRLSDED